MWTEVIEDRDFTKYNNKLKSNNKYKNSIQKQLKDFKKDRDAKYLYYEDSNLGFTITYCYYIRHKTLFIHNCMPQGNFDPEFAMCLCIKMTRDICDNNKIRKILAQYSSDYEDNAIDEFFTYIEKHMWEVEERNLKSNGYVRLQMDRNPDLKNGDFSVNDILGI